MATTAPLLWLDGTLVDLAATARPVMGHAVQRGSLVFDVGSFHRTPRGAALFRAREHVARFLRSARIVGLETSLTEDALVTAAATVVAANHLEEGLVRWSIVFAADAPDLLPRDRSTNVVVAAQTLDDPPRTTPIRVATFDDARKAPPEVLSPQAKAAGAYLGPMIARRRAVLAGADDVVLLDREGHVAEAPIANVFAVVGGVLVTPATDFVLAGITRDSVLALAEEAGIATRQGVLRREALCAADEAFLTSTSGPIVPIGAVDGHTLAHAPGPITKRLTERLVAIQSGRDPALSAPSAREAWLRYVD